MDDQRFDRISRIIAKSTSRRSALKGIAAAIGGGALVSVFGVRPQWAGAQAAGDQCESGEDCTSGLCSDSGFCYCEDPSEPMRGCACNTGTEAPCGVGTFVCCATGEGPGGPGICVHDSVGCNPTGECIADPGDSCTVDTDCCQGSCGEGGVCYCEDPSRPWIGCGCNSGTEAPCGGGSVICCPSGDEIGGAGICTSDSVGCNPTGECSSDPGGACATDADCCEGTCSEEGVCYCTDPARPWIGCSCSTGTEGPCGGGSALCCPTSDEPGGPGVCTSSMAGCQPVGECTSDPGGDCASDADCCEGSCSEEGVCYCTDPARPWIGCSCNTGTEGPCGGGSALCCPTSDEPGGPGVCTSSMAGCQPVGECTSDPGGDCASDADCCEGSCSEDGICYCLDPAEPMRGCSCTTGTESPCGSDTLLCCAGEDTPPGGAGTCTPDRLGCDPLGACFEEDAACEFHEECCDDLICRHGACKAHGHGPKPEKPTKPAKPEAPVTTLPSTGAGPANDSISPLLGAAALAGAAAIAARKLQQKAAPVTGDQE